MPELPEVELVVQSLNNLVAGRTIVAAELLRLRLAPFNPLPDFAERLASSKITGVKRRGKHILFDSDNGQTLIAHLRMSGRFMLLPFDRENPKYTHAAFYFVDDTRLVFQDQRHFGFMRVIETDKLPEAKELKSLAPEPFSDESNKSYFRRILKTSKRSLKEFLLDQTKVTGLGNIYASEAMFLAGVNPQIPANQISARKANALFERIRGVLRESIAHGSTLNVNPENIDGSYYGGSYTFGWRVYDREKEACARCRTEIQRLKQAGRSTYFCPKCQK